MTKPGVHAEQQKKYNYEVESAHILYCRQDGQTGTTAPSSTIGDGLKHDTATRECLSCCQYAMGYAGFLALIILGHAAVRKPSSRCRPCFERPRPAVSPSPCLARRFKRQAQSEWTCQSE